MADLAVTAANVAASPLAKIERRYNMGIAGTRGENVYLDDSNPPLWKLYDDDAIGGNELTRTRGMVLVDAGINQPGVVALKDTAYKPGAALTPGLAVYASTTAGGITHTVPAAGEFPVLLGMAIDAATMNLHPVATGIKM